MELLGDKIGQNRPLKGIKEAATENKRTTFGGVRVCGPGANHGRFVDVGHRACRYRLLGGLRSDNSQNFVLDNHLGSGLYRRLSLGLVVFNDQFDLVLLLSNLETTGFVDVLKPHLTREL